MCMWYIHNVDRMLEKVAHEVVEVQAAVQQDEVVCCPRLQCLGRMMHVLADDWELPRCEYHHQQLRHNHSRVTTQNSACVPSDETWTHLVRGPAATSHTQHLRY